MYYRSLLGLAMVAMASAKADPVTTMLIYGADPQPLAASVVGNDATATTYSINCPPGTDGSDCGMGPGLTLIAGPKTTYKMDEGDFHWTVTCSVAATTSAVCTEANIGGNFPGTSVVTLTTDLPFLPVTVTAGSVATRSATTTTGATTTASSASSASSASGKSTAASTASSSASAAGSAAQSTGGMPQVTAHAGSVLGGAVVALAAAVL